ncbi:nucleolar protein [Fusarium chlamydosporum]
MAPELRKRKSASDIQKPNGAAKAAQPKRKAPEDASPVSLKKQKSVKKTTVTTKSAEKPAQKSKKSKPVEEVKVVEEESTTLDIPDESESEAEEGKEVQAIVDELDSGDEAITEGDAGFKTGQDVGKIPKISKEVQKAAKAKSDEDSGVIYIGRVPHGFYEHEMRQYFEQFGPILALRVSRNKKTGASKHYAFVKFAEASTAEIVAKTMDNYLLFGHILKCRVIPKEQIHKDMFKGANRRFKKVPWNKMAGLQLEKPKTESAWANKVEKENSKRAKKAAKLKEIGYEFDAPEMKDVPAPVAAIENGETELETKAIEAAPAEKEEEAEVEETKAEEPAEVVETVVEKTEVVTKSKAAPKAKAAKGKATKAGKGRKTKA